MPCGCEKNVGKACVNCGNGAITVGDWVECNFWSFKEELPLLTKGNYAKYTNGSVRTKQGALCSNYANQQTVQS